MESKRHPKKRVALGNVYQAINCENQQTKEKLEAARIKNNGENTTKDNQIKLERTKILYTNIDQLTRVKKTELISRINDQKPQIIAIFELKPKNSSGRTKKDYEIPCYKMHPVNLDTQIGRGIAIYTQSLMEQLCKSILTHCFKKLVS